MSKRLVSWSIPLASFVVAALIATFSSPGLGAFGLRMMQASTGTPPPPCCDCDCSGRACPADAKKRAPRQKCDASKEPVRYFTGEKLLGVPEIDSEAQGTWSAGRSFISNAAYADVSSPLGGGWRMSGSLFKLAQQSSFIVLLSGSTVARTFIDNGNGTYSPSYYFTDSLTLDGGTHTFTYTDLEGRQWLFDDFTGLAGVGRVGTLKQYVDPAGNVHTLTYNTAAGPAQGKLSQVQALFVQGANTYEENWLYNYNLTGVSAGLLQSVVLRRKLNAIDQGIVRQTLYSYYQAGGPNGPVNTLQRAQVLDAASAVLDTRYYRYNGYDGNGNLPLRYALDASGYERALFALGSDAAIDAAADATVAQWAQYFLQYDAQSRVTFETVQGAGCGCGSTPGLGTFTFSYTDSGFGPDGPNTWKRKTVETLPDGNQNIVYSNGFGQTMLSVFKDVSTGQQWITCNQYDASGRLTLTVNPSGVTGYNEADPALVSGGYLSSGSGLVTTYTYYSSTNIGLGQVAGYMASVSLKQGQTGAAIPQRQILYTSRSGTSGTIYPLASETVYRNTDGTGAQTTAFTYTWQGSSNQISQKTTTFPIVPTNQNGSGSATSQDVVMDSLGRPTWKRNEAGFIDYSEYDQLRGGEAKTIVDVNTALPGDFLNLPAGWATPAGGGLHLKSLMTLDALARTTKLTDPAGLITYTVYKDVAHEIRVYPGWITSTNRTTGPTQVRREDRGRSYVEKLTMSANPTVTGGVPTGAEAISGLQSLSRDYLDTGDRVTNTDSYFDFTSGGFAYSPNVNIGTLGTNYYRRLYNYDLKGRRDRDVDWTGTIRRTFYDSRNRIQSTWIGTNDTPPSGTWSPSNNGAPSNMVKATENQYDSGGVGDGNRTKSSFFYSSFASLDSFFLYDFRNRRTDSRGANLVALHLTLDNLSQILMVETHYDADLNFAIGGGDLRGKSESKFDERGQIYQTVQHNVFNTGVIGNHLTANSWYDARKLPVKTSTSNGLFRKSRYDGAGRVAGLYLSSDDAETTYAQALDVAGDVVVEQSIPTYDADGNVLFATQYERTSTTAVIGDLAIGWAATNSRRTFIAHWYDLANRRTTTANYGNNGDVAFVRPANPPAPNGSANILVTKFEYDAGGRQYKTTNNLAKITQMTFDGLARGTRMVENFVNGVAAATELDTDKITDTLFDSAGRMSQRIAYNPKGTGQGVQSQITKYVYGTIANQASPAVYRNDVLVAEIHPDSDDTYNPGGAPGAQLGDGADAVYDRIEYTYDYAGRRRTLKDQRQNVHTYAYIDQQNFPGAGQLNTDSVTTLASGTDGSIRMIYYGYDSLSRLQQTNSYADTGFSQLMGFHFWNHDGWGNPFQMYEVHTPTSPAVYFFANYADGAVGSEAKYVRQASATYQNGREVHYLYGAAAGVGDKLNRVESIANDSLGTLTFAQYSYLGSNTPVRVAHPSVAGGLTLDHGAGTGSPGGWDRFGRVIDHKWGSTADPNQFDRFQHTYDNMSMRLTSDRTYTGAPTNRDEQYTYDRLHRLVNMKRGTMVGTTISNANSTLQIDWNALDIMGNWRTWRWDLNGGSPAYLTQTRAHNAANEIDVDNDDANAAGASITQTAGVGTSMDWIDPQYDKSGNMKNGPKPGDEATAASRQHYTYDAWNRLVKVQADSGGAPGATIAEYQYDGIHRRIAKVKPNGPNWDRTDYYHTAGWQVVEERTATGLADKNTVASVPKVQWVWDARYADAPVLRDENKDGDGDCTDGPDERLYYVQDVSWNTTALVNASGTVVERYAYTPYGQAGVFTATWTAQAATVYNNEILFAGYRLDPETQLYHVRYRAYHSTLGRWLQRDPINDALEQLTTRLVFYAQTERSTVGTLRTWRDKYWMGMNLVEYDHSSPYGATDPWGLAPCGDHCDGLGTSNWIDVGEKCPNPCDPKILKKVEDMAGDLAEDDADKRCEKRDKDNCKCIVVNKKTVTGPTCFFETDPTTGVGQCHYTATAQVFGNCGKPK